MCVSAENSLSDHWTLAENFKKKKKRKAVLDLSDKLFLPHWWISLTSQLSDPHPAAKMCILTYLRAAMETDSGFFLTLKLPPRGWGTGMMLMPESSTPSQFRGHRAGVTVAQRRGGFPASGPGRTGSWRKSPWRFGHQIPRGCRRGQREPGRDSPGTPDRDWVWVPSWKKDWLSRAMGSILDKSLQNIISWIP